MPVVLGVAVLALGGAQWARWRRTEGPHGVEAVVLLGALVLAVVGILATVLAVIGVLGPGMLALAVAICALVLWPWRLAARARPIAAAGWVEALLLVGLALALRLPFMDYALAGRDQGTYTLRAEATARTGAIAFVDPVLARAARERGTRSGPDDLLGLYPRRTEPWRTDVYEGSYRPGFYLADLDGGVVVPQFFHLHPMLMTVAAWLVGVERMGLVVVLEGVLAVLAVLAIGRRLWGAGPWPPIAAAVVALSPLVVWAHRNALTEALTGLLTWAAVLACLRARAGARDGLALAAVLLGATAWVRGNAWITAPVVLAVLWLVPVDAPHRWRARGLYLSMLGGSVLVHAVSSFPYLVDELQRQLAAWSHPSPHGLVIGFVVGALAWAAIDAVAFGARSPQRLRAMHVRARAVLPGVLAVALVLAIGMWLARRLGSAGPPFARLDLLPPGLGLPLAITAAIGIAIALPRLRVRGAADVWLAAIAALVVATAWLYAGRNLPKTGLYYYGRYLVPEILPLAAIAAVHAIARAHRIAALRWPRWSGALTAALSALLLGAVAAIHVVQPQTRLQEFEGARRIVDAIAAEVPPEAIVIAGGEGWHHGHTFNQVGGALAIGHGRIVLPYVTREAAAATMLELLVHGPAARATAPPPVFLLINEASHAYTPAGADAKVAALDDLLPPPLRATAVHGLELVVHRLTPDESAWPVRATRDELRMALVRVEVDPQRERELVRLPLADAGLAITGGTATAGGWCLAPDEDTTIALVPELVRDARSLAFVAVPGTAAANHGWSIAIDGTHRAIDPPATSRRARDTIGPLPLVGPPAHVRVRGSADATSDAACPHGGIAELLVFGADASAIADAGVEATAHVPSSDLGHPFPVTRWVAGRGLSRYRSFATPPEIAALSLAARPGAPIRFAPEPLPGAGTRPLDVIVTTTSVHVGAQARLQVTIDGHVIAIVDPPDERVQSWQSPAVRIVPPAPVVAVELELVGSTASTDVAWVRDVTFFAAPP